MNDYYVIYFLRHYSSDSRMCCIKVFDLCFDDRLHLRWSGDLRAQQNLPTEL